MGSQPPGSENSHAQSQSDSQPRGFRHIYAIFILFVSIAILVLYPIIDSDYDSDLDMDHQHPQQRGSKSLWSKFKAQFYKPPPPEAFMSSNERFLTLDPTQLELIRHYGYPGEEHKITTGDGFILTLFRIPRGRNPDSVSNNSNAIREPVIIQHGILCSSDDWLLLPPQDAIPFMLADAGKDVWLISARGTKYSSGHLNLRPDDLKFWDFSFDDMAIYDVPHIINYVLATTKAPQVSWVGHSMGCTMLFIAINKDKSLNTKVRKMVAMAPAVYSSSIISPFFKFWAKFRSPFIRGMLNKVSSGRFLPPGLNRGMKKYGPHVCSGKILGHLCNSILFSFTGYNREQTTNNTATLMSGHMPAETSAKTLAHFAQFIKGHKFDAYDYGPEENMKRYGSETPPLYDLSLVEVEVLIFYGLNDWLAHPADVQRTASELGNLSELVEIADPKFSHMDFMYAKNAREHVYERSVEFLTS